MSIGCSFRRSQAARFGAAVVGLGIVAIDLALHRWAPNHALSMRVAMSWLTILSLAALAGWDRESLGLRLSPVQGWMYWLKATLVLAVAALVLMASAALVFYWIGMDFNEPREWPLDAIVRWLLLACVEAPLYEETIYRLALCAGVVALVGRWPTIVLSGVVFGLLHVVYGNVSPDNVVGGFLLGWAFLKSQSLTVPIILHALGNLVVLIFQLVYSAVLL